jgi:hypothetical protein
MVACGASPHGSDGTSRTDRGYDHPAGRRHHQHQLSRRKGNDFNLYLGSLGFLGCKPRSDATRPTASQAPAAEETRSFRVSAAPQLGTAPVDGRLLVIVAKDGDRGPRHLVSGANDTAQLFGVDVNGFAPGLARA